jgi:cobalt-zinc-cadmium efflux system outer membrane protein
MSRFALAGLLPAFLAASVAAQDSPVVTEAEFLSVLDASYPAVVESAQALALARARVLEASTFENPVLGVVREDPSGPVEQTDWTVSWRLPDAARRPEIESRERTADAAEARFSQDLLSLRQAMREVYAEWAVATARRERLAAQAARVAALAGREALRAEQGEASGLEAHRLSLAAGGLEARAALAAAAADEARARARGWHPGLPADAEPLLPPLPPAPPEAGADHPSLRAAEEDLAAAELAQEAVGRFVRSPELSVGWQRQEAGAESIDGPILGLAWSVPVLDRNRAERAAAEARISGARARLERVRRDLEAGRAAARAAFDRLASALEDARAGLAGNERMLDGAEAAFRHGEASLTDLLETQRSVTESELAVLDLQAAALAAHRELERLAGSATLSDDPSGPGLHPDPDPTPREDLP